MMKEVSSCNPEPLASQKIVPLSGSGMGVTVGKGAGIEEEVGLGVQAERRVLRLKRIMRARSVFIGLFSQLRLCI